MKTFKLCALTYSEDINQTANRKNFPLIDGLIISREDEGKNWLIEAMIDQNETDFFKESLASGDNFKVLATITNEKNKPVPFEVSVHSVTQLETNTHVLLNASRIEKVVTG